MFQLRLHYLETSQPHFFSIDSPYYVLQKYHSMALSNACQMDFVNTILDQIYRIQEMFQLRLHYLKTSQPHFFSINSPYYVLQKYHSMALSNACQMYFVNTIIDQIYRIQEMFQLRLHYLKTSQPHFFFHK